jgi:hypothetical protein
MTVDQFLAWERRQELRYEFDGTALVAMTGGTLGNRNQIGGHTRKSPPAAMPGLSWLRREPP